jgi:hypothetical protein
MKRGSGNPVHLLWPCAAEVAKMDRAPWSKSIASTLTVLEQRPRTFILSLFLVYGDALLFHGR